jgi:DNA-binding GntR family transcriptional regulator
VIAELEIGQTLSIRTAEAIRQRILALTPGYAPGQRLLPEALAESLGVSITPVREALRLLSNDGLVELLPRRGVRVVSMSPEEIRDLTAVRGGIELLAIRLRGGSYSPEEVAELNRCLDLCGEAITARDVPTYRRYDTQIHRLIVVGSHSPTLVNVYEQLHRRAQILELFFTDNWEAYRESFEEHRELVALLASAPMDAVEAAVWTHWQHSRSRIAARFSRLAESPDGATDGAHLASGPSSQDPARWPAPWAP